MPPEIRCTKIIFQETPLASRMAFALLNIDGLRDNGALRESRAGDHYVGIAQCRI